MFGREAAAEALDTSRRVGQGVAGVQACALWARERAHEQAEVVQNLHTSTGRGWCGTGRRRANERLALTVSPAAFVLHQKTRKETGVVQMGTVKFGAEGNLDLRRGFRR